MTPMQTFILTLVGGYCALGLMFCLLIAPWHKVRPRGYVATVFLWVFLAIIDGSPTMGRFADWATYP